MFLKIFFIVLVVGALPDISIGTPAAYAAVLTNSEQSVLHNTLIRSGSKLTCSATGNSVLRVS